MYLRIRICFDTLHYITFISISLSSTQTYNETIDSNVNRNFVSLLYFFKLLGKGLRGTTIHSDNHWSFFPYFQIHLYIAEFDIWQLLLKTRIRTIQYSKIFFLNPLVFFLNPSIYLNTLSNSSASTWQYLIQCNT